jgi:hypothetical protein
VVIARDESGKPDVNAQQIGEIALPARDRQFVVHVSEERVGDAEIAFRVFEIDRFYATGLAIAASIADCTTFRFNCGTSISIKSSA